MDTLTRPPDRTELPAIQERLIGNLSSRRDVLRPRYDYKSTGGKIRPVRRRQREIVERRAGRGKN